MFRFAIAISFLSIFTFNTHASSIPQELSSGADGIFSLLAGEESLYSAANNIYNFANFNIAEGATLNINNSGPVYIYSQQNITIAGTIQTTSSDLHLITQGGYVSGITNSISALGIEHTEEGITYIIIDGYTDSWSPPITGNDAIIGNDSTLTTNQVETITVGNNLNLVTVDSTISLTPINNAGTFTLVSSNPSPVPLPGAIWLMLSGIIGFSLLKRKRCQD